MKVGVVDIDVHVSSCLKEELAWAVDKWLRVIIIHYKIILIMIIQGIHSAWFLDIRISTCFKIKLFYTT